MQTNAILVADLGYGDAGKGSLVDYLARETGAHTVVRYNGGAQAAHNVVTPDGRHHTFAQFGSGSFLPGVRTYLSRFMVLNPLAMLAEERALASLGVPAAFESTAHHPRAQVTTPFQIATNRIKELARGDARHGSCGLGVGETMADWLEHGEEVLFAGDLKDRRSLLRKLSLLRDAKLAQLEELSRTHGEMPAIRSELEPFHDSDFLPAAAEVYTRFAAQVALVDERYLTELCAAPGTLLFEGAQGVLLDEWRGFFPFNTWSTTTFQNAETLLAEGGFEANSIRLGATRAYATRHGPGPFMSESRALTSLLPDRHNGLNPWQRAFRVGHLDLLALRYALKATGPIDGLAVTNLDRLPAAEAWYTCERYRYLGNASDVQEYFELSDGWVTGIRLSPDPTDLERQKDLTDLLFEVQPVCTPWVGTPGAFAEYIADSLNAPLALTSSGPTAREKFRLIDF